MWTRGFLRCLPLICKSDLPVFDTFSGSRSEQKNPWNRETHKKHRTNHNNKKQTHQQIKNKRKQKNNNPNVRILEINYFKNVNRPSAFFRLQLRYKETRKKRSCLHFKPILKWWILHHRRTHWLVLDKWSNALKHNASELHDHTIAPMTDDHRCSPRGRLRRRALPTGLLPMGVRPTGLLPMGVRAVG